MLAAFIVLVSLACLFLFAIIIGLSAHFYPRIVSDDIDIGPILGGYSIYVTEGVLSRQPVTGFLAAYLILTQCGLDVLTALIFGLSLSIAPMFLWAVAVHVLVGYLAMARQRLIDFQFLRTVALPASAVLALITGVILLLLNPVLGVESGTALSFSAFFSAFALLTVLLVVLPLAIGLVALWLRGSIAP